MTEPFEKKTFFALSLDPVHVGTGGYRLGHVDSTILRESGTQLPKIPGSSLNGVTRAYTAMAVQTQAEDCHGAVFKDNGDQLWKLDCSIYHKMTYLRPVYIRVKGESDDQEIATLCSGTDGNPLIQVEEDTGKQIYHSCAGKGGVQGEQHCGRSDCPVCVAFGFSKGDGGGFQGLVQFFDLQILFFPVYSSLGPVWVTSPGILRQFDVDLTEKDLEPEEFWTKLTVPDSRIFIGGYEYKEKTAAEDVFNDGLVSVPRKIRERALIFDDVTFGRIVNDNLEVRTSVSINPETGAAEDGALFTYEAIPRATVMWFDVVYNRPEFFRIGGEKISLTINDIQMNVQKGLALLESLGIGGMNTRGMGRVRVLNLDEMVQEQNNGS